MTVVGGAVGMEAGNNIIGGWTIAVEVVEVGMDVDFFSDGD